jgi:exosortase
VKYIALRTTAGSVQAEPFTPDPVPAPQAGSPAGLGRQGESSLMRWLPYAIIAILLGILYYKVAAKLVFDWYDLPDYSHGFLVPFFSLFLLWDNRVAIRQTPLRPSWSGLSLVALGLLVLILGIYGADLFLSRISFLILLSGLIWSFFGLSMLKTVRFPLGVLLLAIPFPAIVFNQITFPLQLKASQLASTILQWLGVPVLQEGNVINLPVMPLEVAEACSGIRSLMSLFTLALFYGYFLERTTLRRLILALASIPIAVAANAARIVGTGLCVQYWDPDKALGFFHEFQGWVMFVISLTCLFLLHRLLSLIFPPPGQQKLPAKTQEAAPR